MKILFCADIYETKFVGPARFAEMLLHINEIYKGIHEVRVLTADVAEERMPVYKMSLRYPKFLRFLDPLSRGWKYYRAIRRIENEYEFDVVLFGNAIGGIVPKLLFRQRIPITGLVNDYNKLSVNLNNFRLTEGGKGLLLLKLFENLSVFFLDKIVVCSFSLEKLLTKANRYSKAKIEVLHHAIDVKAIPFKPKSISQSEAIKILFVKWRYLLGGLPDLAIALKLLSGYKFMVSIIGPYRSDESSILSMFNQLENVDIKFFGPCPQEFVHQQMESNHILCIPSILEAQGLANVEGLAHGLNVVTTNTGGIPEVLDDGKNGWLCEPGNPESLASALRDCIEASSNDRMKKQINGREFVEEYFDFRLMLKNILSILENIRHSIDY